MLCIGADRLVTGAVSLATRFGVSGFVIGVTVVAYGTSTPELAASIQAALQGESGLILGNVVGSNIANIGMVLGAAATLGVVYMHRSTIRNDIPTVLGISIMLLGLSLDGSIGYIDGIMMLGGLVVFMVFMFRRPRQETHTRHNHSTPYKSVGMVVLGAVLLYVGAIMTVHYSVLVAEWFDIPSHIIGITVIAVGTSLPELITTVAAIRKGRSDIGVANIIGSNILNILFVVGIASLVTELFVGSAMWLHYGVMVVFAAALYLWWKGRQARVVGPMLVISYGAYMVISIWN